MDPKEMIDRYAYQVGQNLSRKSRADIEKEIRSLIEDTLDSRSQELARPIDEEMTIQVLKEFGEPEKMAQSYQEPRYLIGPRFYPLFTLVAKIVLAVFGVFTLIRLGIDLSAPGMTLNQIPAVLVKALAGFFTAMLTAFGNIIFIFAIIERTTANKPDQEKEFDPRKLEARPVDEQYSTIGTIAELVITAFALLLFNFYPQVIVLGFVDNGGWNTVPLLSEAFFAYLPFINLLWGLVIIKNILLLRQGRPTPLTRWGALAISAGNIALSAVILSGPMIINSAGLRAAGWPNAGSLVPLFEGLVKGILVLIIVLESVDIVKELYHLLIKKQAQD